MQRSSDASSKTPPPGGPAFRGLSAADRPALESILRATGAFTEEEVGVALELIDSGLAPAPGEDYRFLVAESPPGRIAGYACYAPAPLTDGVFDLYWVAVDPALQGRGVGKALVGAAERAALGAGGRMLLIETASKPSYAATRAFYAACGYLEEARVRDFYTSGDDKIIYAKRLA